MTAAGKKTGMLITEPWLVEHAREILKALGRLNDIPAGLLPERRPVTHGVLRVAKSKAYRVEVCVHGITKADLRKVMTERFEWDELWLRGSNGLLCFSGKGMLSDGQSGEEAHRCIARALKNINPEALIKTRWTCLDDEPYEIYGDNIERFEIKMEESRQ